MQKALRALLLAAISAPLFAQNCPDRVYGTQVGNGDDVMLPIQPIGFAFPFAGNTYTDVHICTNGYFHLSNGGTPAPGPADGTATAAELAAGSPRISPNWSDHNMTLANGSYVYINSTPTKCTITWDRCIHYGFTAPLFTFQAQLFPTGEIKFFYDGLTSNNSTFSVAYATGLVGVSPGGGVTLPAASDISLGGATLDDTLYEVFAPGAFDMQNKVVHLVPTNPGWVYLVGAPSGCGESVNYGTGCYKRPDSIYEFFASAASMDLSGKTITMLRNTTGYTVLDAIPGSLYPTTLATTIVPGDDVVATVGLSAAMPVAGGGTTSSLTVSSNGVVSLAATGNGNAWTPAIGTFLNWAQTAICVWHDYNNTITGSGAVMFEDVGGIAYITFDGVYSYGTTVADTFQFQFNLASGDITLVFGTMGGAGNAYLVGYSVGGASADPGATDLSSALAVPQDIGDVASVELQLTSVGIPYFGNAAHKFEVRNVPNLIPVAFVFFGTAQQPGIDLFFIGAPGCRAYTTADIGGFNTPPPVAGVGTLPFPIPMSPGLLGATLTAQGVAFSLQNALNLITSNGTEITLGY